MIGLRTKDAELRAKFFAILQKQSGAAAARRSLHHPDPRLGVAGVDAVAPPGHPPPPLHRLARAAAPAPPVRLQLAALTLGPPKPGGGGDGAGAMLAAHRKWLRCTAAASVGSILSPLVELIHDPSSAEVALELWVLASHAGPAQGE